MKLFRAFLILLLFSMVIFAQSKIVRDGNKYYFADRIILKYKNSNSTLDKTSDKIFSKFNINSITPTFNKSINESAGSSDLENIYSLKFSSPYNVIYVIKEISKLNNIEWAEPCYLYELAFDPNDPVYNGTDSLLYEHLKIIKANAAWNLNQGNKDIIVAIVDTGVEWAHPDLEDNIWINSAEIPDNGIDDDGNGFIDDYRGWDFGGLDGNGDNDPNEDAADHGTHVAGLASAVTNNGIGIASIGFNCSIMAVKTSQNDVRSEQGTALIAFGYQGIKYAADNGADIINCSWGGYDHSLFAKSIIDYAVSKGALVVAAAGNDNSADKFYPAGYDGVLSVGGTTFQDQKASWSNYGTLVDVSAPGLSIYSTWYSNSYATKSGTSMASPITAGLAALVASQFPNYSPLQIAEQIRSNTDNIDNKNLAYQYKIGSGRINAFKALSNNDSKSVRITNVDFIEVGDMDGTFESGESVKINLELTNYLNSIPNLAVNVTTQDQNVELIKSGGAFGAMTTLQTLQTSSGFVELSIKPTAAENIDVELLVSYSDVNYSDYEWITISINPTYEIQTSENISLTFNSAGSIGFDDYPTNQKGKGFIYKDGPNLLFEGALLYGTSANTIVSVARDINGDKDNDFNNITPIVLDSPGDFADKQTYAKFNDAYATPKSLGIETEVTTYSFSGTQDANYMFIRYAFKNTTLDAIHNFYAGQFWDLDLDETDYDNDLVSYDFTNNFGYIYDNDGVPINTHIGYSLLSSEHVGFFAMDIAGTNDSVIAWDGFSDEEKWKTLTNGLTYSSVGPSDISAVISGGPFILEPNVKFYVDFVVAAGENLSDLTSNMIIAKNKYNDLPTNIVENNNLVSLFYLEQNYPNPFNPTTTIKYSIPNSTSDISLGRSNFGFRNVTLKVYNPLGQEVASLINQAQKPGIYQIEWNAANLSSGVYYYSLKSGNYSSIKKMILLK